MTSPTITAPAPGSSLEIPTMPARSAPLPGRTPTTTTPCSAPIFLATISSANTTPSMGRLTRPTSRTSSNTRRNASTGTQNPTPTKPPGPPFCALAGLAMATATPTSLPRASSSGPPEFPGFIAQSTWRRSKMGRAERALRISRWTPETTPEEREFCMPKGLPMQSTRSPTVTGPGGGEGGGREREAGRAEGRGAGAVEKSARRSCLRPPGTMPATLRMARSLATSSATFSRAYTGARLFFGAKPRAKMAPGEESTWWFVAMIPGVGPQKKPEPEDAGAREGGAASAGWEGCVIGSACEWKTRMWTTDWTARA
mmetsp:Transcript_9270/g.24327  ORF Transcript_9270/g.24327 Transcript_9270/m.24327 type:complete len:313 (-) Transcript_9270:156-1094(-)